MKIRDTVKNHRRNTVTLCRYPDVTIACAMELGDGVSMELIAATRAVASTDRNAEHEFDAAVLWMAEAERNFLTVHANTEVAL